MNKKTVIITGATSGLGSQIAKIFLENNCNLVLHYCNDISKKEQMEKDFSAKYSDRDIIWIEGSFGNIDFINNFYNIVKEKFNNIDILINNAAITINKPLLSLSDENINFLFNVNINSIYTLTKSVLKNMIKNKQGSIINISSYQALTGGAYISAYATSKAALIGLTKSIAIEYGKYNICVNAVLPGYMETKMTDKNPNDLKEKIKNENCLKRINTPLEVSSFIYFLTTMKNISGQVFNLDSRIIPG